MCEPELASYHAEHLKAIEKANNIQREHNEIMKEIARENREHNRILRIVFKEKLDTNNYEPYYTLDDEN